MRRLQSGAAMGCFLRYDFEKELKSSSEQHESPSQNLGPRMRHCRRSEMRQRAGALACRARRMRGASRRSRRDSSARTDQSADLVDWACADTGAELEIHQESGGCSHAALMIFALFLGASAVVLVCGAIYQIIGTLRDRRRFPPPGRLVRFDK